MRRRRQHKKPRQHNNTSQKKTSITVGEESDDIAENSAMKDARIRFTRKKAPSKSDEVEYPIRKWRGPGQRC